MKYRLIASDLDGTLINPQVGISEKNKQAIRHAISKGVHVAICSGRVYAGAHYFASLAGTNGPLISCNGAVVREPETGKVIHTDHLEKEACLKVLKILKEAEMHFNVFSDTALFAENLDKNMSNFSEQIKNTPEKDMFKINVCPDILEEITKTPETILKVVAINKDYEKLRLVRNEVEKIEGIEVTSSGRANFEVLKKGVSKGRALEILCSYLDISPEETIAIGDNENDISMIRFAGVGVAMGNSLDALKEEADYVTESNLDDGVAQAIMKFVP